MIDGSDRRDDIAVADAPGFRAPEPVTDEADASARLDGAGDLIADDPGRAEAEIEACRAWFAAHGPAVNEHRATYLLAQALVAQGRLEDAVPLIDAAREGFARCGEALLALRTSFGRAHVLCDMGRLDEALATNAAVVAGLDALPALAATSTERVSLLAHAHSNAGVFNLNAGRLEQALASYDRARDCNGGHPDDVLRAAVSLGRARTLIALGRVVEGAAELKSSIPWVEAAGLRSNTAETLATLAEAQVLTGDYADALVTIARAGEILRSIDAPYHRYEHALTEGQAYLALNLNQEAMAAYRDAHEGLEGGSLEAFEAQARRGLGLALGRLGHYERAGEELAAAADLFAATGHTSWLVRTRLEVARCRIARGDHEGALVAAHESLTLARTTAGLIETVHALLTCAELGDDTDACLDEALALARHSGVQPVLRVVLHAAGRRRLLLGDLEAGQALLAEAVELVETERAKLRHETLLGSYAHDKASLYGDLIRAYLEGSNVDARGAMQLADRSKSRSLLDMARGASRGRLSSVDDQVLRDRQTIERDLNAAYHELFTMSGANVDRVAELTSRASSLERQLSRQRLTELPSEGAKLVAEVRGEKVNAKTPVLSYVAFDDELVAFVADGNGVNVVRSVASVAEVELLVQRLGAQRGRVGANPALAERHSIRLERTCRAVLAMLYQTLIEPIEHLLPQARHREATPLIVSPCGALHAVPFHALWDGDAYLRDRFAISIAPSIGLVEECERRRRQQGRSVVVGVADDLAPRAEHEALAVGETLPSSITLVGASATVAAVVSEVAGAGLVHLACHGWFRADNPMFSSVRLADRWLLANEILDQVELSGSTVVLSACDSGRSLVNGGDELLGLVRAFLGAGASTLVASLWPADDAVTEQLMGCFYRWLPEHGPAESLRRAQQEISERVTNPNLWAPFVVIGAR